MTLTEFNAPPGADLCQPPERASHQINVPKAQEDFPSGFCGFPLRLRCFCYCLRKWPRGEGGDVLLFSELTNQLFVGQTADKQRVVFLGYDVAVQSLNDNAALIRSVDDAV